MRKKTNQPVTTVSFTIYNCLLNPLKSKHSDTGHLGSHVLLVIPMEEEETACVSDTSIVQGSTYILIRSTYIHGN